MKILTVVGARPQFVKAATVSRVIRSTEGLTEILIHTGQHYDANMSQVFFTEMQIPQPNYHLGIGGSSHGAMTGRMLEKIEEVIIQEKPDVLLVYGDTNSTLAGALAGVKVHIPVAHVEAGLRSFNMNMPEEVNRVLTDQISKWLLCPTETAVKNLQNEGIVARNQALISNVGDVMYDAALFYSEIAKATDAISSLIQQLSGNFYLATVHRAENTDDSVRLRNIMDALNTISETTPVVLPLHPRTRKLLGSDYCSQVSLIDPVGYFDMIILLSHCKGVFTDSGGLQKESFFFKKPCVTLRNETEWYELIEGGYNILAGNQVDKILAAEIFIQKTIINEVPPLYGEGNAAEKIVEVINKML